MDAALRILDANLNRAREGLRTAEEYARLGLDDGKACGLLRELRSLLQQFVESQPGLAARLLEARDVERDVGTRPGGGAQRGSLEDMARAGIKRAQEALRVVEETAQVIAPQSAPLAARMRYGAYLAEQELFVAAPRRNRLRDSTVMVVFTRALCLRDWRETLRALVGAGAGLFQLREKEAPAGELHEFAAQFRELAGACTIIINDRADVAAAVGADGVHIGQQDLPVQAARRVIGPGRLVGVSTHDAAEAIAATKAGADYIGLGAMFPTASKNVQSFASPQVVRDVLGEQDSLNLLGEPRLPVFCIGGVAPGNVAQLRKIGVRQVAAGAAILGAADPAAAFRQMVDALAE
jgi:thiamine-phosphate pyrophosphorylase